MGFSTYKELKQELENKNRREYLESLDAVDVLTLACRTNPYPVEELSDATFTNYGVYCGFNDITDVLLGDAVTVPAVGPNGKKCGTQDVCPWAFIPVEEKYVSDYFGRKEQNYQDHGYATVRNSKNEKFVPSTDFKGAPMIAVRTYSTVETALTTWR